MATSVWTIVILVLLFRLVESTASRNEDINTEFCSASRENSLNLSNCSLTRIPADLPANTENLDVSQNKISSLTHEDLYRLTKLCSFKISQCRLQFISADAFSNNRGLKVLNISNNPLISIPYLPLPRLRILDLTGNQYTSYKLPAFFSNLTFLTVFAIGSTVADSVNAADLAPLKNTHLRQFSFGVGSELQHYEKGSFAQLKSLKEVTLQVAFCTEFNIFNQMIIDLDQTDTKKISLIKLFPDQCKISNDPFESLKQSHSLTNLSIVDTWMNSSVMVKLIQNIWNSSIEEIAFVNITYNEDTPYGFLFPSQKHSTNIHAVVFDGVNHYQYQYPKINMSMEIISQLTYIKFSGSGMNILPCNLISVIPSLEILDLSNNLLDDTGFWWYQCSYEGVFPSLTRLSLSKNRFKHLAYISKKIHEMKVLTSLDLSFNSIHIEESCFWPSHLTDINLSHNNLGNSVFQYLSSYFQKIDLSKTDITVIKQDVLLQFPKLTHLYLSFNSIQTIPYDLHLPALQTLYIDQNAITSISQDELDGLTGLRILKAGNNPYVCDCDSFWFVTTLNKTLLSDWPEDYVCNSPASQAGKYMHRFKLRKPSCRPGLQAALGLSVIILITCVCSITFYACDGIWYTKMLWVWLRVKRRSCKRAAKLMSNTFSYHAFISYSQNDSEWVSSQLVPTLESEGLSICVHERDFVPGQWIVDNIIQCVESSYKTIFVLSNNFVKSDWCTYEFFFAQHRAISIKDDSLVFIMLEPIPKDSLPKKFLKLRSLLSQQTYLEWPKEDHKQRFFWANLKSLLHTADKNVILKELALNIAENCTLLDAK